MPYTAWENTIFGYHRDPKIQSGPLMNNAAIKAEAAAKMERFDVRPPNPKLAARNFSGGNQQKIVLAREIERNPDILLVGQPTRGVDIGAIEFIHQQIVRLRDEGKAILLVSVELDEIFALSDRIAVMFDGQIMGERIPSETNEQELGLLMAGITDTAHAHMPSSPMAMTETELQEAAETDEVTEGEPDGNEATSVEPEPEARSDPEGATEPDTTVATEEPDPATHSEAEQHQDQKETSVEHAETFPESTLPEEHADIPEKPRENEEKVNGSESLFSLSATISQSGATAPINPKRRKDPKEDGSDG